MTINTTNENLLEKIVALCKRRGFVFPGSEIYGGLAGFYDYGPLGTALKFNIKQSWWRDVVQLRDDVVGISSAVIMNPRVWEASGHVESFADPLVECKKCHRRFRADQIKDKCPDCAGELTKPKKFNLLVETYVGVIEGEKQKTYLRGEITQGVHVNFKNILDSTRVKLPFGVAQIGKAFRNEITPGGFIFRTREFEQMEVQFYAKPDKKETDKWIKSWQKERLNWYLNLGIKKNNLRIREHGKDELAHYAKAAYDIEYKFEGEWQEIEGIHNRGDWDLKRHQEFSGKDSAYFDEERKERYLPWIIETSAGVERIMLALLYEAYTEEKDRVVLKLSPSLAPHKAAVFPLLANKPKLVEKARGIYKDMKEFGFEIAWDDRGNIGKRYYSQDEIGTPYCITVDFQTLEDNTVTVRDRDTTKQTRINVEKLINYINDSIQKNNS